MTSRSEGGGERRGLESGPREWEERGEKAAAAPWIEIGFGLEEEEERAVIGWKKGLGFGRYRDGGVRSLRRGAEGARAKAALCIFSNFSHSSFSLLPLTESFGRSIYIVA